MNQILKFALQKSFCIQLQNSCENVIVSLKPASASYFQFQRTISITRSPLDFKVSHILNCAKNSKKGKEPQKITLLGPNNAMSITGLEEAQKLAKRRGLHLIQIQGIDSKTQRASYKLASSAEFIQKELDESQADPKEANYSKDKISNTKKSEKSLTFGSRITDHDIMSRAKNIRKWLEKGHEVRIVIQGAADDMAVYEKLYKKIEKSVNEPEVCGKIVQKRVKNFVMRFSILPIATKNEGMTATSAA